MSSELSQLRVMTQGFWIPVGRSNFYDEDSDAKLIAPFSAYTKLPTEPLRGYLYDEIEVGTPKLQASVYHRLASVLPSGLRGAGEAATAPNGKRYSRIFPMFTATLQRLGPDSDADAAAYVCTKADLAMVPEWRDAWALTEGLALVTVADGFYVWLALYQGSSDRDEDRDRKLRVEQALRAHIIELVGGDFSSRAADRIGSPGVKAAPHASAASTETGSGAKPTADSVADTLETYRNANRGILSFFQINLIFEGLFNYNLDPRIFFDDGSDDTKVEDVMQYYSLGRFIGMITTVAEVAPEKPENLEQVIRDLQLLFDLPTDWEPQQYLDFFNELRTYCVNAKVRRDVLRQFLRKTSLETLHLLKLRIESCNRSLLSDMITIAHLRQPFTQVEIPPTADVKTSRQARFHIVGANEGQLRGYVILLAAKLPLIENVRRYLDDNLIKLKRLNGPTHDTLAGLERSWQALLQSITENIHGLEQAIDQAYKDQMLRETEKLREEEETLAEIERIRERSGSDFSPSANLTVNIIANVIAFAGVLVAVVLAGPQLQGLGTLLRDIQQRGLTAVVFTILIILVGAVVAVILLYFLLHELADPFIRLYTRHRSRRRQGDEQYYYEMDLRLESATSKEFAEQLVAVNFTTPQGRDEKTARKRRALSLSPRVDRWRLGKWNHRPTRSSYRVNRTGPDEALHKLYVVASIVWPRRLLPTPWFARERMRIFLVYEVLFHSPSNAPGYVIKALRIVSTSDHILSPERLKELQVLVLGEFVNPWIMPPSPKLDEHDALLSLVDRAYA